MNHRFGFKNRSGKQCRERYLLISLNFLSLDGIIISINTSTKIIGPKRKRKYYLSNI